METKGKKFIISGTKISKGLKGGDESLWNKEGIQNSLERYQ